VNKLPLHRVNPLRYPGGKRWFAPYLERILSVNGLAPSLFVEPFAGGAGVALHLLHTGKVEAIALADADPLIAAFWKTVFGDVEPLLNKIEDTRIDLETWTELKTTTYESDLDRAFQCLFLNRTSFSGIIAGKAGPIGGKSQNSKYKIDCRFNKSRIIETIRFLNECYKDRVLFVWNKPWRYTLNRLDKYIHSNSLDRKKLLCYLDPPFIQKGAQMYRCHFEQHDHVLLRDYLDDFHLPWILSYDDCESARELYRGVRQSELDVLYCCSCASREGSEAKAKSELVVSNLVTTLSEILPSGKNRRRVSANTTYGKQLKSAERSDLLFSKVNSK